MEFVKKIDTTLEGWFKGAPRLSPNAKESIAKAWPWIALVLGILNLIAAYSLWQLSRVVNVVTDLYQAYGIDTTAAGLSSTDKMIIYLGIILILVEAVMFLMAFPKLKRREKAGWNLLFGVALLNLVYAVVSLFIHARGIGGFIGSLIGSAIGFYLLFQVKEKFGGNVVIPAASPAAHHMDTAAPAEQADAPADKNDDK